MKYLFFDIECANPKYNSICTFGYVMTDENFGVIEQRDILMNPETGYDKYVIKNILRYPTEELDAQMPFPCYYDEIEKLMCSPETVTLGFSISNDIRFLNETCIRYRLPSLNYRFFDVQKIYGDYAKQDQASIETAGEVLHLNKPFFVHRSDEDARITMEILKAICAEKGMTLPMLLSEAASCGGRNHNFIETWDVDGKQPINHKKNHYKKKKLLAEKRKKKEEEKLAEQKASSELCTTVSAT